MSATYIISPASGDQYASVFSTTSLSSILGTLHKGTAITVLGTTGNYYKIKYDGGSSSSTPSSGIVKSNSGLNARSGPSTSSSKVGAFANNTKLTITSSSNGWYQVNGRGTSGQLNGVWVSAQYVVGNSDQGYGYVSKTDVKLSNGEITDSDEDQYISTMNREANTRASMDTNVGAESYGYSTEKRY